MGACGRALPFHCHRRRRRVVVVVVVPAALPPERNRLYDITLPVEARDIRFMRPCCTFVLYPFRASLRNAIFQRGFSFPSSPLFFMKTAASTEIRDIVKDAEGGTFIAGVVNALTLTAR